MPSGWLTFSNMYLLDEVEKENKIPWRSLTSVRPPDIFLPPALSLLVAVFSVLTFSSSSSSSRQYKSWGFSKFKEVLKTDNVQTQSTKNWCKFGRKLARRRPLSQDWTRPLQVKSNFYSFTHVNRLFGISP